MRPEILNPLFAETLVLKGVGPALAKPLDRLGLTRVGPRPALTRCSLAVSVITMIRPASLAISSVRDSRST